MTNKYPEEVHHRFDRQKEQQVSPATFAESVRKLLRTRSGLIGLATVLLLIGALTYTSVRMLHYREVSEVFYAETVQRMMVPADELVFLIGEETGNDTSKKLKESYKASDLREIDRLQFELRDAYESVYLLFEPSEGGDLFRPEYLIRFDPAGYYRPVDNEQDPYKAAANALIEPDGLNRKALEDLYAICLDIRLLNQESGYEFINEPRSERNMKNLLKQWSERNVQHLSDPRFQMIE